MQTQPRIIRPGLLVSLKSTLHGGVSYQKTTLLAEQQQGEASIAAWETRREIANVAEHALAVQARSKARALITAVCCPSSFGLLCPVANEAKLALAIVEAQGVAQSHNATNPATRLDMYVITGRIADTDEQAARAIAAEIRDLLGDMEKGVKAADPAAIREAANKARAVSGMLSEATEKKVGAAIAEARAIARTIVAKVGKAGETAASVLDGVKLEALSAARFAVLDLSEGEAPVVEATPASAPALDLQPVEAAPQAAAPSPELPSALPEAIPAPVAEEAPLRAVPEALPAPVAAPILPSTPAIDWD